MKHYLFSRGLGIMLAGILLVESSIPVFATEMDNEVQQQDEIVELAAIEESSDEEEELYSSESTGEAGSVEESLETVESSTEEKTTETVESSAEEKSTETLESTTEEMTQEESAASEETSSEETKEETEAETESLSEKITEEQITEEQIDLEKTAAENTLAAPQKLTIVRKAKEAELTWEIVEGATAYRVYRGVTAEGEFTLLENGTITTDSNLVAYKDTYSNADCKTTYYYKVCATKTTTVDENNEVVQEGPFSDVVASSAEIKKITLSASEITLNKGDNQKLEVTFEPDFTADLYSIEWSSADSAIATVENGEVTAVGAGITIITAKVGDIEATCEVTVSVSLQSLALNQESISLAKGDFTKVSVKLLPEDVTEDVTLTWSSSDENIVTVKQDAEDAKNAEITAVGTGTAEITVSAGSLSAKCQVTVPVPSVDIELSESTVQLLQKDDSVNVSISITPADESTQIRYVVEEEGLIQCELGDRVLTITPLGGLGETRVKVFAGGQTAVLKVQVVEEKQKEEITSDVIPVSDIEIEAKWNAKEDETIVKGAINLWLGEETYSMATVTAKVSPEKATNKKITWSSSDTDVVTVDENGVVKAVGAGKASILATADNGVTGMATVVVVPLSGNFSISSSKNVTLYCNKEIPAMASNAFGTHQIILSKQVACNYRSSNEKVATVDENGLITAQEPGNATISVVGKTNGEVKKVTVTVKRIMEDIVLPLQEITVIKGTTPEISFKVLPENTSVDSLNSIKVSLADSNSKIITLDKNWTKGKTSGTIKFTADKAGTESIIIKAGDTYYDAENDKIVVNSVTKEIKVHVVESSELKVASIKLSGSSKMKSGSQQTLTVSVKDKKGNELDDSKIDIGFLSSDTKVATVDAKGKVTAIKGGKAVITAYAMNGSNVKVNYSITVEQRPEEIIFDRPVYGVSKAANKTAAVTVQPRFAPADTKDKSLSWNVTQVLNADGTKINGTLTDYFTVDSKGKVTAKAITTDGMKAVITCTSKAYQTNEKQVIGTVTVVVQEKKVTAVKFAKSTLDVVGLTEHRLPFSTTFAKGCSEAEYETFTSDASIATAELKDGQVLLTAYKYGTVTVTLCADRAVTTTCKVTIYPVAKGSLVAKETSYLIQQSQYNGNDKVQLYFVDTKNKKELINPALFTYESSNPNVVYVDKNGVAYANPDADGKITAKNNQVTITATLKDDPAKRKVKAKVIVCTTEQVERMDAAYYETTGKAAEDKDNVKGTYLTENITGMVFSQSGQKFVLRVTAFGAYNEAIRNAKLSFTSSDKALAEVVSQTKKEFTSENGKYEAWEVVVAVKNPGRFSINVTSQDQKKGSRSMSFAAYSAKPILTSNKIGTINRNSTVVSVNELKGIASSQYFTVLGADGTEIKNVSVKNAKIKLKSTGKLETVTSSKLTVLAEGNNRYRLVMLESAIPKYADGTYDIVLEVERTLLGAEDSEGWGDNKTTTERVEASFTIASTLPKLGTANITINTFIKGDAVKIPINTKETIKSVTVAPGMLMAKEVEVFQQGKDWYARLKDDVFANWKKTKTSGVLLVELDGYEKPLEMNLKVTCKSVKPVVKQAEIPLIQLQHSAVTTVTLVDGQKQVWKDYTIQRKSSTTAPVFQVERQSDHTTKVTFTDSAMKLKSQGVTLTERVLVKKEEWRSSIEVTISVKAYNGNSVPKVSFANGTVNINKKVGETAAETKVKISHSNITLNEGEWKISDACKYKTVENKKTIWHQASEAFKAEYKDGILKISLRKEDVPKGTYKLTMTNLWAASLDANLKSPLTTSTLTVVVKDTEPVVNIKMSGKIDLVKRSKSTLQGTITVSNMNSAVKSVRLVNTNNDGFADKFYCVRKNNTFTIYARNNAVLTTSKITGRVEITMSDGNVLYKAISLTPTQSTPSVITPASQTIYKSASDKTVDYNFNEKLTEDVRISDIKAVSVPKGLQVQDDNGHLYVTLGNKALKQGKYKVEVNVYFKGAQAITGDEQGKAVKKTIYVEVKE